MLKPRVRILALPSANVMGLPLSNAPSPTPPIDAFDVSIVGNRVSTDRLILVSARVLLAFIFVFSGIMKIFAWDQTIQFMSSKGFPVPQFFLFMALLIEIGAGLLIAFGRQVRVSAGLLFLYLIPTTLIFHDFWNFQAMEAQNQLSHFLKNLAIMGGLLILYVLDKVEYERRPQLP